MSKYQVFVDESRRANTYYVIAVVVLSSQLGKNRSALGKLLKPGQSAFHAKKENDSRRKRALFLAKELGVSVVIYRNSDLSQITEIEARHRGLVQLGQDLKKLKANRLVLEHRQGQDDRDTKTLLSLKRRQSHQFDFSHLSSQAEPLLWLPDIIGWAYGKKGRWRKLVTELELVD